MMQLILDFFLLFCMNNIKYLIILLKINIKISEEHVGLIYGLRGLSFVLTCLAIPILELPPKLSHTIGIFLESLALGFIGCSIYFDLNDNI